VQPQYSVALTDMISGLASFKAWWSLAKDDLQSRYRRTKLGPFWVTISHAASVSGLAILSTLLTKQPLTETFVYVAAGLTVWALIASSITEGSSVFISSATFLTAYDLPMSLHVYRAVTGQLFAFAHNMLVFIVAFIALAVPIKPEMLLLIPGLTLLVLTCASWTFWLGVLGARFRDLTPLLSSVLGLMMILTPVFWRKSDVAGSAWLAQFNPLYHLIQIVRAPLLGEAPTLDNWLVSGGVFITCLIVSIFVFVNNRRNLTYWL
jgi:lipopolysaccharide transport system permease protein